MVRISGELYVGIISVIAWYEIVSVRGVKEYVFVLEVDWKRTLFWNESIDVLGFGWMVSRSCSRVGE